MDLSKMSDDELLAMEPESHQEEYARTSELARRLAAAEAAIAEVVGALEHTQFIPTDSEAAFALSCAIRQALQAAQAARNAGEVGDE